MIALMLAALAALPDYAVGDAFVYSDGRVERVLAVDGTTVDWGGLGQGSYRRSANPVAPILAWQFPGGEGRRVVAAAADALWPLAAGKTARFSVVTEVSKDGKHRRSVALWTCRVGAAEEVRVAAGDFSTLPIACDRYSPATMRLAERIRWNWAPDIGHYVRRATTLYYDGSTSVIELYAAIAGEHATLPRLTALSRAALAARDAATAKSR